MSLLLLRHQGADAARSPELRYLASCLKADARRIFDHVEEVVWPDPRGRDTVGSMADRPVLVIGGENVHLGRRSLERMRAVLEEGAEIVLPRRLASFPLLEEIEPIYTLRDFEAVEKRLLEERPESHEERRSHLPVALFSSAFAASRLAALPLEAFFEDDLLAPEELDRAVHDGIFHGYVDYYGEVREDILPFVGDGVREVLEIGCGRGLTGRLLRERRGCRVTGVELNPEVAREAERHLHRVIVGDIEELEITERFDLVVATELFEHLNYPEVFLEKMVTLLEPGGKIVLSVPNVGHYSVVEDLLAGRFDYLPIGLLCYTHFRFFTRASLAAWIERAGFSSYEIVPQKTELPERFNTIGGFETDPENLATQGFYAILDRP